MLSARKLYNLGMLLCIGLFTLSAYLQFSLGFSPCALCQLQRITLGIITFFFLIASVHNPSRKGINRYGWIIGSFSIIGTLLALRQVYIQSLPTEISPTCGMNLDYLLAVLPLDKAIKMAFQGAGECATVAWRFLWLTMAEWGLLFFVILAGLGFYPLWKARKVR
jgi:protein dithiol:quinone oxidoreductase